MFKSIIVGRYFNTIHFFFSLEIFTYTNTDNKLHYTKTITDETYIQALKGNYNLYFFFLLAYTN